MGLPPYVSALPHLKLRVPSDVCHKKPRANARNEARLSTGWGKKSSVHGAYGAEYMALDPLLALFVAH